MVNKMELGHERKPVEPLSVAKAGTSCIGLHKANQKLAKLSSKPCWEPKPVAEHKREGHIGCSGAPGLGLLRPEIHS